MTQSILRKLARDFHEGQLNRVSYQQRRRQVIDDWVRAGGELPRVEAMTATDDTFPVAGESQPDASDLASALANRDIQASGRLEPPEPVAAAVTGVPGTDGPPARVGRDNRLSGLGTAAPERPGTDDARRWAEGSGSLAWYILAALAAALLLAGYLLWR